jgi:hypothetical protein
MATKSKNGTGAPEVSYEDFEKGLEDVGNPDVDGWYKPEKGSRFAGRVEGRFTIVDPSDEGSTRDVVLVRLAVPTKAVLNDQEIQLGAGQVLAVGIRAKLGELLHFVDKRGKVMVECLGQQKIKGGRTMWQFKVKGEAAKRSAQVPIARGSQKLDDQASSDVPF